MTTLQERLRKAIADDGRPIARIAREAGFSQNSIHNWLAGKEPRLPHIRKMAAVLGVGRSWLAFGEDEEGGPAPMSPGAAASTSPGDGVFDKLRQLLGLVESLARSFGVTPDHLLANLGKGQVGGKELPLVIAAALKRGKRAA